MNKTKQTHRLGLVNKWVVVAEGEVGDIDEEEVQASSYKINKPWGCNIQHKIWSKIL